MEGKGRDLLMTRWWWGQRHHSFFTSILPPLTSDVPAWTSEYHISLLALTCGEYKGTSAYVILSVANTRRRRPASRYMYWTSEHYFSLLALKCGEYKGTSASVTLHVLTSEHYFSLLALKCGEYKGRRPTSC